jgi:hypothetical protein
MTTSPSIASRRRRRACALLLWLAAASAVGSPLADTGPAAGLREIGHGHLSFLGFPIYAASLWSADGRWNGLQAGQPVALSLAYQRRFTRDELIRITTGELTRLGLADPQARLRWAAALGTCWRDVGPGDTLTAVVVPGLETRFYDEARLLGAIDDPAFGPAYLSIWLDPRSAVRDLRAQLLGQGPADRRESKR